MGLMLLRASGAALLSLIHREADLRPVLDLLARRYEITGLDVWSAYRATLAAADRNASAVEVKERIRQMVAGAGATGSFVAGILSRELELRESDH